MKTLGSILTSGLLCLSAQAAVINGDFGAGFSGWTLLGSGMSFGGVLDEGAAPVDVGYITTAGGVDFVTWREAGGIHVGGFGDDWLDRNPISGSLLTQTIALEQDAVLLYSMRAFGGLHGIASQGGFGVAGYATAQPAAEWGWTPGAIPLVAGTHTLILGVLNFGEPGEFGLALDSVRLVDPVGWFDYGPDGFYSDNPYPGDPVGVSSLPSSVPEPSAALALGLCVVFVASTAKSSRRSRHVRL
jgi:hypothetical protein